MLEWLPNLDSIIRLVWATILVAIVFFTIRQIFLYFELLKKMLIDAEVEITKILVITICGRIMELDSKLNMAVNYARESSEISKLLAERLAPEILNEIETIRRETERRDPSNDYREKL